MFLAPWSRSSLKKKTGAGTDWEKNQEPEPLGKKLGAGAAKKFSGSPALGCYINPIPAPTPQKRPWFPDFLARIFIEWAINKIC